MDIDHSPLEQTVNTPHVICLAHTALYNIYDRIYNRPKIVNDEDGKDEDGTHEDSVKEKATLGDRKASGATVPFHPCMVACVTHDTLDDSAITAEFLNTQMFPPHLAFSENEPAILLKGMSLHLAPPHDLSSLAESNVARLAGYKADRAAGKLFTPTGASIMRAYYDLSPTHSFFERPSLVVVTTFTAYYKFQLRWSVDTKKISTLPLGEMETWCGNMSTQGVRRSARVGNRMYYLREAWKHGAETCLPEG